MHLECTCGGGPLSREECAPNGACRQAVAAVGLAVLLLQIGRPDQHERGLVMPQQLAQAAVHATQGGQP